MCKVPSYFKIGLPHTVLQLTALHYSWHQLTLISQRIQQNANEVNVEYAHAALSLLGLLAHPLKIAFAVRDEA